MNCEHCGAELRDDRCPVCGVEYRPVCIHCQAVVPQGSESCPVCGGEVLLGWSISREEMERLGIHAFLP